MQDEKTLKWFDRMGVTRPTHLLHGVTDTPEKPLSEQLERLECKNWHIEGNLLRCETDQGPLVQYLPTTDYICLGTDENNLPILKRVVK